MLTREIAEEIVRETMKRLNRNINIMDNTGTIIASGDPTRIDQFHQGALEVLKSGRALIITENNLEQFEGAQLGINLPIEFQGKTLGVIGITGHPGEVEKFGELVKMTTEMMVEQSFLASQWDWNQRITSMLIEEVIKQVPNWGFVEHNLELLATHLSPPFSVVVLNLVESGVTNQRLLQTVTQSFGSDKCIVGFIRSSQLFVLVMGLPLEAFKSSILTLQEKLFHMSATLRMGVGTQVEMKESICRSYHEAQLALLIEEQDVVFYSDTEPKSLMYQLDHGVRSRFVDRVLSNLPPKLIETLQVLFHCNLNIAAASRKLYVHRNTLIYRLGKIKERTGRDPLAFQDAVTLQAAIWAYTSLKAGSLKTAPPSMET
ncbi:helix-turn-helix domain-containing protein [Alicyclobacillus tolerans]|uniref:CdaR family transcriptional regulator n=1 Tax=Alicyclobacillus tolerans TaxID=90970 RepID=UPI001F3A7237|nr:sugar diacid recognition domain-containing protein [Alicyclobacillus tolerans]MCF8566852.1 helix-turn-helix domain-containing protein [Alicyclobacillus tolerans]